MVSGRAGEFGEHFHDQVAVTAMIHYEYPDPKALDQIVDVLLASRAVFPSGLRICMDHGTLRYLIDLCRTVVTTKPRGPAIDQVEKTDFTREDHKNFQAHKEEKTALYRDGGRW